MPNVSKLALLVSVPLVLPFAPVKPVATVNPVVVPAIKTQVQTSANRNAPVSFAGIFNQSQLQLLSAAVKGAMQVRVDKLNIGPSKQAENTAPAASLFAAAGSTNTEDCTCHHASQLYDKGDYKGAAFYYHKAGMNMEKEWGPYNNDVAQMKYNEALCYYNLGQYQRADAQYDIALKDYNGVANVDKSAVATVYWGKGLSATGARSWSKAVTAYKTAVGYYKNLKPSQDYANCLSDFAACYHQQGKTQKYQQLIAESQQISHRASS